MTKRKTILIIVISIFVLGVASAVMVLLLNNADPARHHTTSGGTNSQTLLDQANKELAAGDTAKAKQLFTEALTSARKTGDTQTEHDAQVQLDYLESTPVTPVKPNPLPAKSEDASSGSPYTLTK